MAANKSPSKDPRGKPSLVRFGLDAAHTLAKGAVFLLVMFGALAAQATCIDAMAAGFWKEAAAGASVCACALAARILLRSPTRFVALGWSASLAAAGAAVLRYATFYLAADTTNNAVDGSVWHLSFFIMLFPAAAHAWKTGVAVLACAKACHGVREDKILRLAGRMALEETCGRLDELPNAVADKVKMAVVEPFLIKSRNP